MSTAGPNYATTCTDGGGGTAWTNPSNAVANDSTFATVNLAGTATGPLQWEGFGFAIPSGATIDGIEFEVNRSSSVLPATSDANVYLLKAGVATGTNKAFSAPIGGLSTVTYGGPTDLWGTTWSVTEVNASDFGAQWAATGSGGRSVSVDFGRITIYYTSSGGTDVTATTSSLTGTGTLPAPTPSTDQVLSASAFTATGTLPNPPHVGQDDVVVIPEPGYLAGSGVIAAPLVITNSVISAGSLVGSGGIGESDRAVNALSATGTLPEVSVDVPPSIYVAGPSLAAEGTIAAPSVNVDRGFSVSPLTSTGTLPSVSVGTNGNISVSASALAGNGRLGPASMVWTNWTSPYVYSIYANDAAGGAIDYSAPYAVTQSLTWTSPALSYPGEWKFGVRVSSLESGLEEKNVDAAIRLVLDATGVDITNKPKPPTALRVFATAGGEARAEWAYPYTDRTTRPTGFRVYTGPSGSVDYGTVHATKAFGGPGVHSISLTGFTDGTAYSVGVRAYNATATETNTDTADFTADSAGPDPVSSLAATAI